MSVPGDSLDAPSSHPPANRGRGGRPNQSENSGSQNTYDGRGRGAGSRGNRGQRRGRGRGQGHGHDREIASSTTSQPQPLEPAAEGSSGRPPGGGFGVRLTEAASKPTGDSSGSQPQANEQEEEGETEAPFVIFTDDAEKRFEEFHDNDFVKLDDNLGIRYEKDVIFEDTVLLLRYNCPDRDCDVACLGWPDLHRHVKTKHGKMMCDLCTRNKKVFTHEHELFTFGELRRHEKYGDDNPGAVDQSGFKGHPECGFCKQRFYGDDELYTHCREKHERCHICDRRNGGRNPQYYLNYQELEKHFEAAHFVCLDAECQANKTNVFESEMDLKAHQLSEHPNGLSKDARRDARLVNLSGFDIRTPYQPQRRGGERESRGGGRERDREGRGAGRGRDPNAEPLPMSSAQPVGRAEQAFQRQLAITSSQSVSTRNFGGQLTQAAPAPRAPPAPTQQPQPSTPTLESLTLDSTAPSPANLTPQEQARALRHQTVTDRASTLLKNDKTKLSQFRTHVSAYRSGTTSATDLIDSFFSLFDCPSTELGKLIRELADLYDDDTKRQSLLSAWNNWRSINEDYPSLPGPSGTLPGVTTGGAGATGGRRVLTLKKSTAQSSRSAVSRQGSWGNALTAGTSRDPFPALSATNGRPGKAAPSSQAAWSNTTAPQVTNTMSSAAPVSRPAPVTSASQLRASTRNHAPPRQTEDMFPSLPAAAKPNTLMAGFYTRGSGRLMGSSRNSPAGSGTATPVNAWSNGGSAPTPAQAAAGYDGEVGGADETMGTKRGKKSKKGETLFHFG
ncbi:hypothetical protein LTR10_022841 [Elasticomyces elasticus]|uniref:C2H2-type domain-containing protein n=1 Tax=Exophiala sideris TaxID=1016849 RepID=A0ABR0JAJ9_9EURO|nr:hypothetical protein LTR10_022841 [Elasticomyces elasticus]KAK5026181.1 hypothetical protein LTS07_007706 [Exophiala sideris]KAK5032435.1 hypothetical protein LTR13_007258 [Exophiala sideris]KAK5059591.1 hypothetical protein LTR69_006180 [Exophiala sideris]KAK5178126.1 hypothetical protein LTR44_009432 [Eurotiomycetes sp. CCFEE 6388]